MLSYGIVDLLSPNGAGFIAKSHGVKHFFEDSMHSDGVVERISFVDIVE